MDSYIWIHQKGQIHQLCADTGCCLEYLPGVIDDRNRRGEKESSKHVLLAHLDNKDADNDNSPIVIVLFVGLGFMAYQPL